MSTIRYLSAADVEASMPSVAETVDIAEAAMKSLGNGTGRLPPKIDLGPGGDDFLHAMPAASDLGTEQAVLGMKWIAGYPGNPAKGLPYIHGIIALNNPETGTVIAIMDAAAITARRTGACTAVTARHLADPKSEVISILGCGTQGRSNLEALLAVFPDTERVLCYDIDTKRQAEYADWVSTHHEISAIIPPDPRECTEGAHILVTSAPIVKNPQPVIEPDWLQTGTLCVALDFDAYFTPATFERADLFVTDDLAQFRHYQEHDYFEGIAEPTTDLPSILTGKASGRPDGAPIVLAANLGLGILDVALGREVLRRAEELGKGTVLDA
jgi:ornithine cyclodeaminase/alanine dehydrogenase